MSEDEKQPSLEDATGCDPENGGDVAIEKTASQDGGYIYWETLNTFCCDVTVML